MAKELIDNHSVLCLWFYKIKYVMYVKRDQGCIYKFSLPNLAIKAT